MSTSVQSLPFGVLKAHMCADQVAFPYLYNNRPRKVRLANYHYPMVMYIKAEDPELPAFYYDPLVHPITTFKGDKYAPVSPPLSMCRHA